MSCSRTQYSDSAGSESRTSNPSIPGLTPYQRSHWAGLIFVWDTWTVNFVILAWDCYFGYDLLNKNMLKDDFLQKCHKKRSDKYKVLNNKGRLCGFWAGPLLFTSSKIRGSCKEVIGFLKYDKCSKISNTSYLPKRHRQIGQIQIRLLLKKQSVQGLPYLLLWQEIFEFQPWKPTFYMRTEREKCSKF